MFELILAAAFFVGIHVLIAGSRLRDHLVARIGESLFRAVFSAVSVLGLWWLVTSFRAAPYIETWGPLPWFKPIAVVLMLIAFLLVTTGLTTKNPAAVAGESALTESQAAHGILRITRHPFLWGLAIWAFSHVVANGDLAALVLFGSLLALCLAGTRSIDAKRQRIYGTAWDRFAAVTSNLPFQAILQGRNQLQLAEIGWLRVGAGVLLYAGMLHAHLKLFGVSPLL
jgi:uncharacterized membrane protein